MNGQPLSDVYGAPLRLRVENQLGYKMVKWVERIAFVRSEKDAGAGEGGKNEDDEYFDLLAKWLLSYRPFRPHPIPGTGRLHISATVLPIRRKPILLTLF
jgi:DMSO/TMAO reductase YedYZ molybdopterin-dependent catalytic subunit